MNDMISETEMRERLTEFQRILTSNSKRYGGIGVNWWWGFKKQHASRIVSKKGEKFALNRADWTKLSNIKQMYEYIYEEMVDAPMPHLKRILFIWTAKEMRQKRVRDLGWHKNSRLSIQTTSFLQMKVGVRQT